MGFEARTRVVGVDHRDHAGRAGDRRERGQGVQGGERRERMRERGEIRMGLIRGGRVGKG